MATGLPKPAVGSAKDDDLLVWDINGNGQIDSGAELFGKNTVLSNGSKAANGFAALDDIDNNDDGELLTLDAAGVQSLNTEHSVSTVADVNDNQHQQEGSFTRTDGSIASMVESGLTSIPHARLIRTCLRSMPVMPHYPRSSTRPSLPALPSINRAHCDQA